MDDGGRGLILSMAGGGSSYENVFGQFNRPREQKTLPAGYKRIGDGNAGAYHTYDEVVDELNSKAASHSNIMSVSDIGTTHEGRAIKMARITGRTKKKTKGKKAEVLFMGQTHAREYISAEVALGIIKTLTDGYGKDENITRLVNERDFYIVPVVNPDGSMKVAQELAEKGDSAWRKNTRDNNGDGKVNYQDGVDLNRNFDSPEWGSRRGSSSTPSNETYRGTHAFSEPETAAIRDLATSHKFSVSISYHSYSNLILYPVGYTPNPTKDEALFRKLSENMRDTQPHEKYTVQKSYDLYPTVGDSDSWLYESAKVLPFTFEIYRGGTGGGVFQAFNPPEGKIKYHVDNNVPAALYLAGVADNPAKVLTETPKAPGLSAVYSARAK